VAKAFNLNFASLYDQVAAEREAPGCLYCSDDEAREVTERLIRDASFEPVFTGGRALTRQAQPYMSDPGVVSTSPVSSRVFRPERIIGQPP